MIFILAAGIQSETFLRWTITLAVAWYCLVAGRRVSAIHPGAVAAERPGGVPGPGRLWAD